MPSEPENIQQHAVKSWIEQVAALYEQTAQVAGAEFQAGIEIFDAEAHHRRLPVHPQSLQELDEIETDVAHRAARLYRFDKTKYDRMVKQGFNFEI